MKLLQGTIFAMLISLVLPNIADATHKHHQHRDRIPIVQLTPKSSAVHFEQVTFDLEIGTITGSDWGQFRVKPDMLRSRDNRLLGPGYINVFTFNNHRGNSSSWVINNLFIPAGSASFSEFPPNKNHASKNYQFSSQSAKVTKTPPSTSDMAIYFDLRPGMDGQGVKRSIRATVLFSPQPLPTIVDIAQLAQRYSSQRFLVSQTVINAEGAGHVDGRIMPVSSTIPNTLTLGPPPQPVIPSTNVPDDLLFPIQVIQSDQPNLDAGKNQCIPMAHANAMQYLEDRYNNLPLAWLLPQPHIRGIGKVSAAGDVLFWEPVPENSLVANIDSYSRRSGVLDLDTGGYTSFCGLVRGVFGYLADPVSGTLAQTEFRHQGSDSLVLGDGADCDNGTVLMGGITSQQEGQFPTWEWMFSELQKGRAVSILFSWYDNDGDWKGGHSVRVYGAAQFNGKNYIYTLDDGSQGDNFSNVTNPRTQQFEVADTGQPGDPNTPDGRLNMDGMSWEIDFALSYEAIPTLVIP